MATPTANPDYIAINGYNTTAELLTPDGHVFRGLVWSRTLTPAESGLVATFLAALG